MEEPLTISGVERLATAVQELSLARDLDTVMKIVRKVARELTGADGATFVLRESDMCFYADEDAISPLWKGLRFPMSACISGWVMLKKQAAVVEDIYLDDRIPIEAYQKTFVKSLAMVPIRTIDPIGAIGNYWGTLHSPTQAEVKLLQALADITAVTLENIKVYSELEQRVKERTAQLEAVNKEMEAFCYSVSHDLRAPLRSINGYVTILLKSYGHTFDEEGSHMANRILSNVSGMEQLINDLLAFFSMGRKELARTTISMKQMVAEVWKDCTEENRNANIELHMEQLPEVNADKGLMRQVWVNLISNALKYAGKKQKTVVVIGVEEREDHVIFYVKDNGVGFDMKYYSKLFGVFQRLHSAQEFDGTGIGLAIVEKVISRHGGNVWAEGKVGEGASFYFSLPK